MASSKLAFMGRLSIFDGNGLFGRITRAHRGDSLGERYLLWKGTQTEATNVHWKESPCCQ